MYGKDVRFNTIINSFRGYAMDETCELKYDAIDEKVRKHDDILEVHTNEITALKLGQNTTNVKLDAVCDKLDKLISAIYDASKTIIGSLIAVGLGFIVWYIQKA